MEYRFELQVRNPFSTKWDTIQKYTNEKDASTEAFIRAEPHYNKKEFRVFDMVEGKVLVSYK